MSTLITGYKGYIGSHLYKLLPDAQVCDIQDGLDFSMLKDRHFNTVIHLAAQASVTESLKNPEQCLEENAFKLIPFLTNNRIDKFIFASTGGAIYGEKHQAKEEDANWSGCISPYGQSKYLAEQIIRRLQPNHVILRLGNVFGGEGGERLVHQRFKVDNPIVVYGGNQVRDFVHIDVVCQAILKTIENDITGTFNIGSGETTQVAHIAEDRADYRDVPIIYEPARVGEITHISLDVSKAREAGLI